MSSRVGLRFFQNSRAAFRNAQRRFGAGRRFQSSDAPAAEQQTTFQRLWNSPIGVKTVHFWYVVYPALKYIPFFCYEYDPNTGFSNRAPVMKVRFANSPAGPRYTILPDYLRSTRHASMYITNGD
jgi:hypothetical protein